MTYEHIDADRLARLARDLVGDVRSCLRFVDDFVGAWNGRLARVSRAVDDGSLEEALASLLSIATSGRMVGAERLGLLAEELHAEVRVSRTLSRRRAEHLAQVGDASCRELLHLTAPWRLPA